MTLILPTRRARTLTYRILIAQQGMCLIIWPNGRKELDWMLPGQ